MTSTMMIALGGLLVLALAAGLAVARRLVSRRLRLERAYRRSTMRWRADSARKDFERLRARWEPDLAAAMADRMADLDRERERVDGLALDAPDPSADGAALTADYERFGALVTALGEWQSTAAQPRADVRDLLSFEPGDDPASPRSASRPSSGSRAKGPRLRPPSPRTISQLADRLRALDDRGAELIRRIPGTAPADWPSLRDEAVSLAEAYRRLRTDAFHAWERAFPDRAAARADEARKEFDHYLADARRRMGSSPSQRPAGPSRDGGFRVDEDGWQGDG
ncbi:hypothetical protein AB0K60_36030 [Thermopolyspora sp. NPDC052614]|uniref:hypothetical protein n=1 Tax=Thermopolyspora sp. NPDC052614 TaxID=3155682 RepID=UPI00343A3676